MSLGILITKVGFPPKNPEAKGQNKPDSDTSKPKQAEELLVFPRS